MRYLGAHLSASGGLKNAITSGEQLGINTIQTMFSAPMRWSTEEIKQTEIESMATQQKGSSVKKVLFHGIYLINLARSEKQKFHLSKMSVLSHLNAAGKLEKAAKEIGADMEVLGMTFHPGSAIDLTPEEGLDRIGQGLNWILERAEDRGMLLLESSAGAGNIMGDTLEELAQMRERAEMKERVGYVLDTQHMYVSGYDWVNKLDEVVDKIDEVLQLTNVKAIHLNDSMKPFDSHRDRHANLGEGEIGLEAITNIVNHPKLKEIPFILETPGLKTVEGAKIECEKLQEIAKE